MNLYFKNKAIDLIEALNSRKTRIYVRPREELIAQGNDEI
jgi:hypothetical protein